MVIRNIFLHAVSKFPKFTPFASINMSSKRELLIISENYLPLSCASIHKSSLVMPHKFITNKM